VFSAFSVIQIAGYGFASQLETYLKARQKYGINEPTTSAALETLVGKAIIEIRGIVKGTIRTEGSGQLLLEGTGGTWISVVLPQGETWLDAPNTRVRLLVEAERQKDTSPLAAKILLAIPDDVIANWERQEQIKKQAAINARANQNNKQPTARGTNTHTANWHLPPHDAVPHYAAFIKSRNPKLTDKQASDIAQGIIGFSVQYGVDARLITAMVLVESGFNPSATSHKGAMGLGQLMPGTAKGLGVRNAYDTHDNLWGTVKLVRSHLEKYSTLGQDGQKYGDLVLMLAAYNAGSGAVKRHGGVPPYKETQGYIQKVISWYKRLSGAQ
jgi:soluble lytic murein transglycosylase-like protein